MFTVCPKCGHAPLPAEQALPAACPGCGVILAKVARIQEDESAQSGAARRRRGRDAAENVGYVPVEESDTLRTRLLDAPQLSDPLVYWSCVGLWVAFAIWGISLIAQDYRSGEMVSSFIHKPLLVFHEAGHVVFRLLGEWAMVLGGTLGQLIMPAILAGALFIKNRDPFGASIGLWLFGVSLLDIAPYIYDALHRQLMLLSGTTGEEGGHDWIYLLASVGMLPNAPFLGGLVHKLGALTVLLAMGWGAWILRHRTH